MTPRGSFERVEMGHTAGPWRYSMSDHLGEFVITGSNEGGGSILPILGRTHNFPRNAEANARLIAAAPDHALLLAAIVSGRARVEPLGASVEVCTGGLRYATKLGENGCPLVSDVIRTALLRATMQR